MRIRTKLVLAFLLLAVLPLAAIVAVNYLSSIDVFRRGVESEVRSQALELNERMDEARVELGRKIRALGSLSLESFDEAAMLAGPGLSVERQMSELGELAPVVESVEVIPLPPRPADVPGVPPPPSPPPATSAAPVDQDGDSPPRPDPFVIYLDSVLEATSPETGADLIAELGGLGVHAERLAAAAEQVERRIASNERQVEELSEALQNQSLPIERRDLLNEERRRAVTALRQAARDKQRLEREEVEALQRGWEQAKGILGESFDWSIQRDGRVVAQVRAQISPQNLLASILRRTRRDQGEIPFAIGPDRALYTVEQPDRERLDPLELGSLAIAPDAPYIAFRDGWLVVASLAPESDVVLGIARPIGESLAAMRRNAGRNFALGLGAIVLATAGILPLSRRMTRSVRELSRSVDRLAAGEPDVEVKIRSRDEIGQLARNFNRLAADLQHQRERLVAEVRRREEQETRERLLEAENRRKSRELEDARDFQLSLLPAALPEHPDLVVAVHMQTATEVGGDYYDFLSGADGSLTVAIGDATGHGAKAGTMVTAIKSLFTAAAGETEPAGFLVQSSGTVKRMNLGRMAMALTLVRYRRDELLLASAGMPPPLLWRARSGEVEEIQLSGLPLGGLADSTYDQTSRVMLQGDVLLLMSDGFPELPNPLGDPLGYPAVKRIFARLAPLAPRDILAGLREAAAEWRAERPLLDDITFVLVQHSGRTHGPGTAGTPAA